MNSKKVKPTFIKKQISVSDQKLKGEVQLKRNRDTKCFKCQRSVHCASEYANHQVMILTDEEEIMSTSKKSDYDDMPPLKEASDFFIKF